jgi:methionyl-tRNA synthetase
MKSVMELAHFGNRYFDARAPWALIKQNRDECGTALHVCCRIVKALCINMSPFLPFSSGKLWNLLGYEGTEEDLKWEEATRDIPSGQTLDKPYTLFKKLDIIVPEEKEESQMVKEKEVIGMDALHVRIGQIEEIEDHPDAEKLYVMNVDFGSEKRQLVAGLKTYYTKEEMQDRKIVVVMNLKPAKLRGIESRGMLLAAEDKSGVVSLLAPLSDEDIGVKVTGRGLEETAPKKQISFSEFLKIKLKVGTITEDEKTDFGDKKHNVEGGVSSALSGTQIAMHLAEGKERAVPLVTENGGYISVHRPVANGAEIK